MKYKEKAQLDEQTYSNTKVYIRTAGLYNNW